LLPEGHQTVGTRLDITHTAATPVGMRVTARAVLTGVDGRRLTFHVSARDDQEMIGEGCTSASSSTLRASNRRAQEKAEKPRS